MDIFDAARNNRKREVAMCLQYTQVNARDNGGATPLIIAAYYSNIEIIKILLAAGADTEFQDERGNTALMGICFKGHAPSAKLLIENGASVHAANENNATALIFAATFGHDELIRLLLDNGANPLKKDRLGRSALDYALIQENMMAYEMMITAIHSGASISGSEVFSALSVKNHE